MKVAPEGIPGYQVPRGLRRMWSKFWMRFAGLGVIGRMASRLAAITAPPHKARIYLARFNKRGYIAPNAVIYHSALKLGRNVFVDDGVVLFQRPTGGAIELQDRVCIFRDTIMETGYGGSISLGHDSSVHPRCQINAYLGNIRIGEGVMIAPNCAFYAYDHGIAPDRPISEQPICSTGDIVVGDGAWIGFGSIVLAGTNIGNGAIIGAGSLVKDDVPDGAIAVGIPAKVVRYR